jgi:hypothetical protein
MKVAITTPPARWQFLRTFYADVLQRAPISGIETSSVLVGECFHRYLKKFTFRPKTLKLSLAEAMALKDCLIYQQAQGMAPDPFIHCIIYDLQLLIANATPT